MAKRSKKLPPMHLLDGNDMSMVVFKLTPDGRDICMEILPDAEACDTTAVERGGAYHPKTIRSIANKLLKFVDACESNREL